MKKGFTLVEILVTVAIAAIFLSTSLPVFSRYKQTNNLDRSAEMVQSGVYEARNLAMAPLQSKKNNTSYYGLQFLSDKIVIFESSDTNDLPIEGFNVIKNISISSPVSLNVSNLTNGIIYFSILEQGKIVKSESATSLSNIILNLTSSKVKDRYKEVSINYVTGQVSINEKEFE